MNEQEIDYCQRHFFFIELEQLRGFDFSYDDLGIILEFLHELPQETFDRLSKVKVTYDIDRSKYDEDNVDVKIWIKRDTLIIKKHIPL
jgi:hypothetical protein